MRTLPAFDDCGKHKLFEITEAEAGYHVISFIQRDLSHEKDISAANEQLLHHVGQNPGTNIIVDFSKARWVSSAVIKPLLDVNNKATETGAKFALSGTVYCGLEEQLFLTRESKPKGPLSVYPDIAGAKQALGVVEPPSKAGTDAPISGAPNPILAQTQILTPAQGAHDKRFQLGG